MMKFFLSVVFAFRTDKETVQILENVIILLSQINPGGPSGERTGRPALPGSFQSRVRSDGNYWSGRRGCGDDQPVKCGSKPGYTRLSGSNYSTWWNGGLRTAPYFHNMIGILTEIIGNTTPSKAPLVPERLISDNATIIPKDQADFPTAVKFINTLIKSGIQIHRASVDFTVEGRS